MYLYSEYVKAKVYTIWVHGPLGYSLARLVRGLNEAVEIPTFDGYTCRRIHPGPSDIAYQLLRLNPKPSNPSNP